MNTKMQTLPETPSQETSLTTPLPPGSGLEGITPSDIGMPYIKVIASSKYQGAGDMPFTVGSFRCEKPFHKEWKELNCRILNFYNTRSYYENKNPQPGKQPDCKSFNGLVPATSILVPQSKYCAERDPSGRLVTVCPKAIWVESDRNSKPQKCQQHLNLVIVPDDISGATVDGMPNIAMILPLTGKLAKENGKNFLVSIKFETEVNKMSLCDLKVNISTQKDSSGYYVPVFKAVEWLPDNKIRNIYSSMFAQKEEAF